MPRKRSGTDKRRRDIGPATWAWLRDEPIPHDAEDAYLLDFVLHAGGRQDERHESWVRSLGHEPLRALWAIHGTGILAEWVRRRPGTRPSAWWLFVQDEPPPSEEAQAAYLTRRGLLLPGERRRLGVV